MKEQIQDLIAHGRVEEALQLLVKSNSDAVMLQARYNNGKKQYNMGLIDFGEWQRVQNQVNFAILEMAASLPAAAPSAPTPSASPAPGGGAGGDKIKVFISYNHGDAETAHKVRDYLHEKQIDVIIDEEDMPPGMSIMEFIQNSIKQCDAVLSIVSGKSLSSGWVGQESVASMYAIWLADKQFIPVRLDGVVFDIDFQIAAQKSILQKIKDLDAKITELKDLGGHPGAAEDERSRLNDLKNNLGKIIQRLNSVLILDISGDKLIPNMDKVYQSLR